MERVRFHYYAWDEVKPYVEFITLNWGHCISELIVAYISGSYTQFKLSLGFDFSYGMQSRSIDWKQAFFYYRGQSRHFYIRRIFRQRSFTPAAAIFFTYEFMFTFLYWKHLNFNWMKHSHWGLVLIFRILVMCFRS